MHCMNRLYLIIISGLASLFSLLVWSDVTFINTTNERLIVRLLSPAYDEQGIRTGIAFGEEFVLWENDQNASENVLQNEGKFVVINSCLDARQHTMSTQFITDKTYEELQRSWLFFKKHKPRPAETFMIKGFFCFDTKCEHDVCGVIQEYDGCRWLETEQLVLEDGATYIISAPDDAKLVVKKGSKNAPVEKNPWRMNKIQVVGTYFSVYGKVN